MNKNKLACAIAVTALGISIVVYGGYDDSPGAQLIGLILVVVGIVYALKRKKAN